MTPADGGRDEPVEPPPFFRSWRPLYAAVLLNLGLLIGAFYVFSEHFR